MMHNRESQFEEIVPMKSEVFQKGLAIRRELAGERKIDEAFKNADEFELPMQELVTEFCWGAVWTRPDLDRRSRSILNLGMIGVLNRPEELAGHIRIALKNGVTKKEVSECFLQVAAYAGMPAGLGCFKVMRQVFAEPGV